MNKRVTGIGGIFFKSRDPKVIKNWYREYFGLDTDQWAVPSGGRIRRVMTVPHSGVLLRKIQIILNLSKRTS